MRKSRLIIITFLAVFALLLIYPVFRESGRALAYNYGTPSVVTNVLAGKDPNGAWVTNLYKTFRAFTDIILVIILIIVAFANILHINLDTYEIKKMLPKVIFTAVAANLALPIFALASRMVDSLQTLEVFKVRPWWDLFYIFQGSDPYKKYGALGIFVVIGMILTAGINWIGCAIAAVIFLGAVIIIILLGLVLSFRPYIVYLSAAAAPIAIVLSILPQTQSLFKRWLGIAVTWMFMPLVVYMILYVGDQIPTDMYVAGNRAISTILGTFLPFILRAGLLILAFRFPFMIEKDISSLIKIAGKGAGAGLWKAGKYGMGYGAYRLQQGRIQKAGKAASDNATKEASGRHGLRQARYQRFTNQDARALGLSREEYDQKMRDEPLFENAVHARFSDDEHRRGLEGQSERDAAFTNYVTRFAVKHGTTLPRLLADPRAKSTLERRFNRIYRSSDDQDAIQEYVAKKSFAAEQSERESVPGKLLRGVQALNVFAIPDAIKLRKEGLAKEMEKAPYKAGEVILGRVKDKDVKIKPIITTALGDDFALKYQQAVKREDQSNIHSQKDLEEDMGWSYRKLVESWMEKEDVDQQTAINAIQGQLKRLYISQASAQEYNNTFGKYGLNANQLATIIEGYQRGQSLAASTARYPGKMEQVEQNRTAAMNQFMQRMAGGASGAPSGAASQASAGRMDNFGKMTLFEKRQLALEQAMLQELGASGKSPGEAHAIIDALKYTHDGEIPAGVAGAINSNAKTKDLAKEYVSDRAEQINVRLEDPTGQSSLNTAEIIGEKIKALPTQEQKVEISNKILESSTVVRDYEENDKQRRISVPGKDDAINPTEYVEARKVLVEAVGGSDPELINAESARKAQRSLEVLASRNEMGDLAFVEDKANIKVRTALQVERDVQLIEVGEHLEDIERKVATKTAGGKKATLERVDEQTVLQRVRAVAEPHLELTLGQSWTTLPAKMKDEVISRSSKILGGLASGDNNVIEQELPGLSTETQVFVRGVIDATRVEVKRSVEIGESPAEKYSEATQQIVERVAEDQVSKVKSQSRETLAPEKISGTVEVRPPEDQKNNPPSLPNQGAKPLPPAPLASPSSPTPPARPESPSTMPNTPPETVAKKPSETATRPSSPPPPAPAPTTRPETTPPKNPPETPSAPPESAPSTTPGSTPPGGPSPASPPSTPPPSPNLPKPPPTTPERPNF